MSDTETTSNWIAHVKREIHLGGLDNTFYGDLLPEAIMELAEVFDKQGHSGLSASIVSRAFFELANWNVLAPLTSDPDEWNEYMEGKWQSRRQPSAFSEDGGITYRITGKDEIHTSKKKVITSD